ncbi:MAG TPA: hypothetical protein PLV68_11895, partial [Ilumatobacteraceae bacterium]|nr:hypothetical protein [Ilumatobacteraceae bacterium]
VAGHLAQLLGDQVRHIGALRRRADAAIAELGAAGGDTTAPEFTRLTAIAAEIATARAGLENDDRERQAMIAAWSELPRRLAAANERETIVRDLRATCQAKVTPVPNLAVPDVDALVPPLTIDEVERQPW